MNAQLSLVPQVCPARYLVLDIETGNASDADIETVLRCWKPPSNLRDQTKIEERRQEAALKIRERSALLDSAPILCVGIQTDFARAVFNGIDDVIYDVGGIDTTSCGNERDMLLELRKWLDINTSPDTILVGHNVRGFDLPKLRSAYMRNKLLLPNLLAPKMLNGEQTIVDTAYLFKSFSVEHRDDFCPSLTSVCNGLNIPQPKVVISGAEVPKMHQEGRYVEILTYNMIDVLATARAYLLMSGNAEDLQ